MNKEETIKSLIKLYESAVSALEDNNYYIGLFVEEDLEALETAISVLSGPAIKVEVTEIHKFAKPEDTSGLKFGD